MDVHTIIEWFWSCPSEIVCLALAVIGLIAFSCVWSGEKHAKTQKDHTVFRFWKFGLLLFSGASLLFGGNYIHGISDAPSGIRNVLESVYGTLKLFFAGGDIGDWTITDMWLKAIYSILYFAVCALAVIFTATTVLSFFHDRAEMRKLGRIGNRRNLYVFNEPNEKALSIAQSVKDSQAVAFVFCNADENDFTFMEQVKKLPLSFCLKNDVTEVYQQLQQGRAAKRDDRCTHRYFLLKEDQPENVRQAIAVAEAEQNRKRPSAVVQMFVFAQGVANGRVLDGLHNTLCKKHPDCMVRRISPAFMLAKNVVTYDAYDEDNTERLLVDRNNPDQDLTVLIVGMGQYGLEIAKMLTWFYQRKDGHITVHLTDRATGMYDRLKVSHMDWVDYRHFGAADDDSCFCVIVHEGMDVYSTKFEQLLKNELAAPDAVYVALGDDDLNIEAAYYIRGLLDRIHYQDIASSYRSPSADHPYIRFCDGNVHDSVKIFSVVHDDKRCDNLLKSDMNAALDEQYHIQFVGRNSEVFCFNNIYPEDVENTAKGDHIKRQNIGKSQDYHEYFHLSSLTNSYHKVFMKYLYGSAYMQDANRDVRMRVANKRWNAYMRAGGYRCVDTDMTAQRREELFVGNGRSVERLWRRGTWHNSIVPFSQKGPQEQKNNLKDEEKNTQQHNIRKETVVQTLEK